MAEDNPEEILNNYKRMLSECQQIATKIHEVFVLDCSQSFLFHNNIFQVESRKR